MNGWIGVTDTDWFDFLSRQPGIDEVNFWQLGGRILFRVPNLGEPVLFQPHAPHHFVASGDFLASSAIMPAYISSRSRPSHPTFTPWHNGRDGAL